MRAFPAHMRRRADAVGLHVSPVRRAEAVRRDNVRTLGRAALNSPSLARACEAWKFASGAMSRKRVLCDDGPNSRACGRSWLSGAEFGGRWYSFRRLRGATAGLVGGAGLGRRRAADELGKRRHRPGMPVFLGFRPALVGFRAPIVRAAHFVDPERHDPDNRHGLDGGCERRKPDQDVQDAGFGRHAARMGGRGGAVERAFQGPSRRDGGPRPTSARPGRYGADAGGRSRLATPRRWRAFPGPGRALFGGAGPGAVLRRRR